MTKRKPDEPDAEDPNPPEETARNVYCNTINPNITEVCREPRPQQ